MCKWPDLVKIANWSSGRLTTISAGTSEGLVSDNLDTNLSKHSRSNMFKVILLLLLDTLSVPQVWLVRMSRVLQSRLHSLQISWSVLTCSLRWRLRKGPVLQSLPQTLQVVFGSAAANPALHFLLCPFSFLLNSAQVWSAMFLLFFYCLYITLLVYLE